MEKKFFRIQTLSENGGSMDPISIITGGAGLLTQFFPNLFNTRTPMTRAKLNEVFPGNGYWTVLLKNYLLEHTQWTVDMKFWFPFEDQAGYIQDFAYMHRGTYAPQCPNFANCAWQEFQQILKKERVSGGNQPSGQYPGGLYSGSVDFTTLALVGGGLFVLFALSKKKSRAKK